MHIKSIISVLLIVFCCAFFSGCGEEESVAKETKATKEKAPDENAALRDSTPKVLQTSASGEVVYGNDILTFDVSHTDQGYFMLEYRGDNDTVRMQVETPSGLVYTYAIQNKNVYEAFPLPDGNGAYKLKLLENIEGKTYAISFVQDIEVTLADEFLPFLYPSQYVNFTAETQAVEVAKKEVSSAKNDLDAVAAVYHYIIKNIDYDKQKAESVVYGYLPNLDDTLTTKKGICFDYAALMAAMLRTQGIPTKLETGYASTVYHAWISTYITDVGWIDKIIEFDGQSWTMMDPTFAANSKNESLKKYIGDSSNYNTEYIY
ncbi:hypothetical protein M2454_001027 [Aequitasia blattaphilus]|uniref:Transglutaminase-like domain-containing protein n=1 Tax=Aequitasia blattaphilus TaxID=2949332 RepID=A0ABT1E954_9FIRM|nr:transglutaminase-like domain-containing protein [Aequitasia blattaphilus]MCP1102365.1 transglutaminase-like domain-containing protein [Aequitasia blattaphilus]MCR8615005.1 transglutaminase-like domain-containing protein [Aequitasia blattaphilus]